jgi:hypothetical protein
MKAESDPTDEGLMQIHGPDPGFVRPVEAPPPPIHVPSVQTVVAVAPTEDTQSGDNNVKFQDPNRDGRRSLYQELGGRYVGFFRTRDLNLHRTLNIELDFGPHSARQEFIITMEAFLETGFASIHHGLALTANLIADDVGHLAAIFPPLVKVLADPTSIAGFHVYAFPLGAQAKPQSRQAGGSAASGERSKLNLRPPSSGGGRFDTQA